MSCQRYSKYRLCDNRSTITSDAEASRGCAYLPELSHKSRWRERERIESKGDKLSSKSSEVFYDGLLPSIVIRKRVVILI